jgi:hypothetical protein
MECEKLIRFHTNCERARLQLKRLNILRKCICDAVHAEATLRWEDVLKCVDKTYIIEYAIADRKGTIQKDVKKWEWFPMHL